MTKEKYNTKDIRHIDEKNQEYIAEGNRMTEEIIIDVSGCPHKSDDDCMEVPICNEYGDLMGYQSCEAQTLCPYRSQKKIERLEQELKWANDEEKYLKDCCIKAGKELEKHSFKWDGKEKNLVVQALQLNQLYEKLEQENKELKEMLSKEPKAMQAFQISYSGLKRDNETLWGMVKDYKTALEEIREVIYYCGYKDVVDKVLPKINEVIK